MEFSFFRFHPQGEIKFKDSTFLKEEKKRKKIQTLNFLSKDSAEGDN